jgi:micrococcal nuclease
LGLEAQAKLQQLVDAAQGKVAIVPTDRNRHKRTVAEVFLLTEPEQAAQQELLTAGLVYVYPQYINDCPNALGFKMAEAIAREQKVGLWAGNYQRPWDYRKGKQRTIARHE